MAHLYKLKLNASEDAHVHTHLLEEVSEERRHHRLVGKREERKEEGHNDRLDKFYEEEKEDEYLSLT